MRVFGGRVLSAFELHEKGESRLRCSRREHARLHRAVKCTSSPLFFRTSKAIIPRFFAARSVPTRASTVWRSGCEFEAEADA